jgi:hypothetical protein
VLIWVSFGWDVALWALALSALAVIWHASSCAVRVLRFRASMTQRTQRNRGDVRRPFLGRHFGDTHAHGEEGFHFFTRGKVITTRWLDPSHGGLNLGFSQNA